MGIEYSLVNHQDKTCFELGKGSWYALCDHNRIGDICLLYEDQIYDVIINEIWDYNIEQAEDKSTWHEDAKNLAKELFIFINSANPSKISLANDCDDSYSDVRQNNYRWIGSRYSEQDLDDLNRHLK
jgi:hypothetical protein